MDFLQFIQDRSAQNTTLSFDIDNEYISAASKSDS